MKPVHKALLEQKKHYPAVDISDDQIDIINKAKICSF